MKEMYFAGMSCDKLTEDTVAFQFSTIRPEIVPMRGSGCKVCDSLQIPMKVAPNGLVATLYRNSNEQCPFQIDFMCAALPEEEHCYDVRDLREKLRRTLITPRVISDLRLVAVTIVDGRLCFKLWQPAGFLDVKVRPDNGVYSFHFNLQVGSNSRNWMHIAFTLDGDQRCYVVEQYRRRHGKDEVVMAKAINYRPLRGNKDKIPHFNGYMETLTVQ